MESCHSFSCHVGLRHGCVVSPTLFALFIEEFTKLIQQSRLRGVQLYPDVVEILLLLFADDIALIGIYSGRPAETVEYIK